MNIILEFIQFIIFSTLIVVISKYLLVTVLRKLSKQLKLSSRTTGNIAGIATSVPELLTVSFSAFTGLIEISSFNIISSNIINFIQYLISIFINKNQNILSNKALKIDIIMIIFTILLPLVLINVQKDISIIPAFILLFILFYIINKNAHKLYLSKVRTTIEKEEQVKTNKIQIGLNFIYLILIAILLYLIGSLLSNTLTNLCIKFNIPEFILGVLLGVITSIPELITFIESQKHHMKNENRETGVVEATNNLLTSNIMNLFIIQSIGILIYTIFA
ncbi:MAG: hypothetical protein ACLUF5_06855 [Clostridia bacterium]|jgi:Ca2+/Na+ antiporter|nr:k+-dependent Na+/Ca+ exchanger related-protein [Clostridium sp. CAG:798]